MDYKDYIVDVPDFPGEGVLFRDLSPLYLDPAVFEVLTNDMSRIVAAETARQHTRPSYLLAAEARGFILGSVLARKLCLGFAAARKPGKLPRECLTTAYQLEYGVDTLELHGDALADGAGVIVFDDLLASGGTAAACCDLVSQAGGHVICCAFIVELTNLKGRDKLPGVPVVSLVRY